MGLSAPKNRSRIGNDPQNTHWSSNTDRFGHKILTSQGWTPGSTLGAKDASHSSHYTVASNSHIRVLLKDDNLGLGAKRGSERAENFGLAGLNSVLARLNGKEAEVKEEEARREEIDRRGYVARRYGFMNFVSGGFLVGDRIERKIKTEVKTEDGVKIKIEVKDEGHVLEIKQEEVVERTKDKKRKRSKDDAEDVEVKVEEGEEEQPKLKRKKKSMNLRDEAAAQDDSEMGESTPKKDKKDKKDKKKSKKSSTSETESAELSAVPKSPAVASEEPLSDKAKRKAEKRARKEEKKLKKALKKAAKEAARSNSTPNDDADDSSSDEEESETPAPSSVPTTGTSTPSSVSFGARGHHAARARHIRMKKMASMDPQALKEIFMIKTPS